MRYRTYGARLKRSRQNRRRESGILLIVLAHEAAAVFDFVTADAVVLLHQAPPFDHLLHAQALIGLIALANFAFAETAEKNPQRFDVFISEVELRHQLLDALGGITARRSEFMISPIVPGFLDIGAVAEEKLLDRF